MASNPILVTQVSGHRIRTLLDVLRGRGGGTWSLALRFTGVQVAATASPPHLQAHVS